MLNRLKNVLARDDAQPLWPSRWWWAILIIMVIGGGVLRFTGYDFSLPFIEHPDEPSYMLAGQMVLDHGSAKLIGMHGYPPGIITLNAFLLRWFRAPSQSMSEVILLSRTLSVIVGALTIAVVGLIGYRVGPPIAGLAASALWAVHPTAAQFNRIATGDTYILFFTLLAVLAVLTSISGGHRRWARLALIFLILAILFKYQAIFIAPVILLLPLWSLVENRTDHREMIEIVVVNSLWFLLFMAWLILIYPSLEVAKAPGTFEGAPDKLRAPALTDLLHNLQVVFGLIAINWLPGLLSLVLLSWKPARKKTWLLGLLVLAICWLLWCVGMSFFGTPVISQFLAVAPLLCILFSVGLCSWIPLIELGLQRVLPDRKIAFGISCAAVILVLLITNFMVIERAIAEAQDRSRPDRRNDLVEWADTSLAPGPIVADDDNHKIFNPDWGGYQGLNQFPLIAQAYVDEQPIEEWRAQGVEYVIMPYWYYEQMLDGEVAVGMQDEMTRLKIYAPSPEYRGPSMVVFRLYPIQHEADGELAPISLIGYDIDASSAAAGEAINFRLYWQADEALGAGYRVYNHLVPLDAREPLIAQIDGAPHHDERRTTMMWDDPDEVLISRMFTLTLPADAPAGEYRLITGFYRPDTGERLLTSEGEDYVLITTITITD